MTPVDSHILYARDALEGLLGGHSSQANRKPLGLVRKIRRDGVETGRFFVAGNLLQLDTDSIEVGRIRSGLGNLAVPVRFRVAAHRALGGGTRELEWILIGNDQFADQSFRFGFNVPVMAGRETSEAITMVRWRAWTNHECGFVKVAQSACRCSRAAIDWGDGTQFEDEVTDGLAVFLTPSIRKRAGAVSLVLYDAAGDVLTRQGVTLSPS